MFNPEKFLDVSKKILQENRLDKESRARTSISRSYHGAFLLSKTKLEDKLNIVFKTDHEIHKEVIEKLKESDATLGDKLNTLNDFRIDADLSVGREIEVSEATHCLSIANILKDQLKKI